MEDVSHGEEDTNSGTPIPEESPVEVSEFAELPNNSTEDTAELATGRECTQDTQPTLRRSSRVPKPFVPYEPRWN